MADKQRRAIKAEPSPDLPVPHARLIGNGTTGARARAAMTTSTAQHRCLPDTSPHPALGDVERRAVEGEEERNEIGGATTVPRARSEFGNNGGGAVTDRQYLSSDAFRSAGIGRSGCGPQRGGERTADTAGAAATSSASRGGSSSFNAGGSATGDVKPEPTEGGSGSCRSGGGGGDAGGSAAAATAGGGEEQRVDRDENDDNGEEEEEDQAEEQEGEDEEDDYYQPREPLIEKNLLSRRGVHAAGVVAGTEFLL